MDLIFIRHLQIRLRSRFRERNPRLVSRQPMEAIRSAARQHLPASVRKPLGWMAGQVYNWLIRPFLGLLFDLKGGRFRADGCVFEIPRTVTTRAYRSCFLLDDYEVDERQLIPRFVRSDDRVLELGACLGIVSCITNRLLSD